MRGRSGSSPLSRGIRGLPGAAQPARGIIPALAGNTPAGPRSSVSAEDHPRSHGEYLEGLRGGSSRPGSSPLSRGIRGLPGAAQPARGIIPALAGNTALVPPKRGSMWDHPRSRGEYEADSWPAIFMMGSSPLSRGIRARIGTLQHGHRIIPALAGNTQRLLNLARTTPDHPRSRGEYLGTRPAAWAVRGSSPLSRGIRGAPSPHGEPRGIIPALAGNTPNGRAVLNAGSDHPRSRGEYEGTKGTRTHQPRIIPALAGNTKLRLF